MRVTFPDGTTCEMARRLGSSSVRYLLELRERNGQLEEKRGTCTPPSIPPLSGGVVVIEHDAAADPSTPNTPLLVRDF